MKKAVPQTEAAFRLVAISSRDIVGAHAASIGTLDPTARLIIRARMAQFDGDVTRSITLLRRALAGAPEADQAFVADLLGPLYVMRNDRESLVALLDGYHPQSLLHPAHIALRAVSSALGGKFEEARVLRQAARSALNESLDELVIARTLQRIGLAAYHSGEAEEAAEASLEAVAAFREVSAFRAVAACYSVAYSVHHTLTGDVERAYEFASMAAEAARASGDASYETGSRIAQYELAAELADDGALTGLRTTLQKHPLPEQYRERFASALAELLQIGWASDFTGLRAAASILGDAQSRSVAEATLCKALRCLAETALGEDAIARKTSRNVLSRSDSLQCRGLPPHEQRYLRLARVLSGAACISLGDVVRGRRTLSASFITTSPEGDLASFIQRSTQWPTAPRRIRGYARLVASVRDSVAGRSQTPLTPQELHVLQLLADGKSAPQIARETNRSVHTIRAHTRSIIAKFSVNGKNAAISHARNARLLS